MVGGADEGGRLVAFGDESTERMSGEEAVFGLGMFLLGLAAMGTLMWLIWVVVVGRR
jgi:hypothetical protein